MRAFALLMGVMLLLLILYEQVGNSLRQLEKEEKEYIFYNKRKDTSNWTERAYRFFSAWIVTRRYLQKVKERMDVYYPGDEKHAILRTMQVCTMSVGAGSLLFCIPLAMGVHWTISLVFFSGIYFIHQGVFYQVLEKEETALMQALLSFLSDMRHAYHETGMIEESIAYAIHDKTPQIMRLHGAYLLEVIEKEEAEEEVEEYLAQVPNPYLRELMILCITNLTFGDQIYKGKSLFLDNIRNLKYALSAELLRRKKQKHLFGGYSFILSAPLFTLPLISNWAKNTMPSLAAYYDGTYGMYFPFAAFFVTWILYQWNLRLKESWFYQKKEHDFFFYLCNQEKIKHMLTVFLAKNKGQELRLALLAKEAGDRISVEEILLKRLVIGSLAFVVFLFALVHWRPELLLASILLAVTGAILCSYYPIAMLYYERLLQKYKKMDEIMEFHAILYMLAPIPQMSAELILYWLERFARTFQKSITKCVDYLEACEEEAMKELYEEESYEPFKRLLENLMASDRIGVQEAFDELSSEQEYFQEERKQQNEITLENRAAIGTFISMVPTFFIVGGYLFLPFILESVSMFTMQLRQAAF